MQGACLAARLHMLRMQIVANNTIESLKWLMRYGFVA